jgi:predicted phage terminase large subunit-like protein
MQEAYLAALANPEQALIDISRVECRRSFAEFVKQAWHIIEPGTPLNWNWHLDVLCAYIQAFFERRLRVPRLILNVPPGPMRDDSQVETARGVVRLRDIKVGDKVLTHLGRYRRVSAVHDQGMLPILEITTHAGRVTHAAPSHPYLTPSGWVNAEDLKEGDVLAAVNPREPRPRAAAIDPEEARLLGYLVGDGSVKRQPGFTNGDMEIIEDFEHCAHMAGFNTNRVRRKTFWHVTLLESGRESPRKWLDHHGLMGKDSYTKRAPRCIRNGNRNAIANFLGAYWSCDGGIDARVTRTRGSRHRAYATTVSQQLADDLLQLLALCGIEARVRRKSRRLETRRQPGGHYESYSVEVQKEGMTARVLALPGLCSVKHRQGAGCKKDFDRLLWEDPIVSIREVTPAPCKCLTVEEDHSFVCSGIAVKNTMKSVLLSVMAPAWVWTWKANRRLINLTNEIGLATRDSMRMRAVITSDWYQARWGDEVTLASDQREKTLFANTATGFRQGLGISGNLTGKRGSDLIIDDPLDAKKAFSDIEVTSVNDTYDQAVSSRLNTPAEDGIALIMQRLRTNDLTGHLLAKKQDWVHVRIPMRYEAGHIGYDPVKDLGPEYAHLTDPRTRDGELMFPKRFPEHVVQNLEEDLGDYGCTPGEAPVLMGDLSMKPISEVKVGDQVVGFDKRLRTDGKKGRMRLRKAEVLEVFKYPKAKVMKVTLASGESIRCTPDHKWYRGCKDAGRSWYGPINRSLVGTKTRNPRLARVCPTTLPEVSSPEDLRLAGWLAGFFDGEGSATSAKRRNQPGNYRNATNLMFYQGAGRNLPLCEKLETALDHFGFDYTYREDERKDNKKAACYGYRQYRLVGNDLPVYQRFLHIVQPVKWRDRIIEGAYGAKFIKEWDPIVSVEDDGEEDVYALKTTTGNYVVWGFASSNSAGQLQQRPSPLGGGIIKKQYWQPWPNDRPMPTPLLIFASYDTAFSQRDHRDAAYSARTTWMVFEDDATGKHAVFLLGAWWDRVGFPELRKEAKTHNREFNLSLSLIERKASGISLIQQLRKMQIPVRGFDPGRNDKVARAYLASPLFEAGLVYYPPNKQWVNRVIEYVATFPNGAPPSADLTDTITQAIIWVRQRGWTQVPDEDYEDDLAEDPSEEDLEDHPSHRQAYYG